MPVRVPIELRIGTKSVRTKTLLNALFSYMDIPIIIIESPVWEKLGFPLLEKEIGLEGFWGFLAPPAVVRARSESPPKTG